MTQWCIDGAHPGRTSQKERSRIMKVRIRVDNVEVDYDGEEEFLTNNLPRLLKQVLTLVGDASQDSGGGNASHMQGGAPHNGDPGPLGTFLGTKNAREKQVRRFLATAEWCHLTGKQRLSTRDVTSALNANRQSKLRNASDSLNNNVRKGHCVKDGKQFYVTEQGRASLT